MTIAHPTTLAVHAPGGRREYPATALQVGMLFHAQAHPGTGVDIEQISMELNEDLDLERFLDAWRVVFQRHAILRASFSWTDSTNPSIIFNDHMDVPVAVEDWRSLTGEQAEERTAGTTAAARYQDFDLANGPLHRLTIAATGPNRWWVLWTFHHTLLDGRSFPLVLREVFELYDHGFTTDEDGASDDADFGRYLEAMATTKLDDFPARDFWRERLSGFETANSISMNRRTAQPADPGPADSATIDHIEVELGVERTDALRHFADRHGISLNTCLQGAWYLTLQHYTQHGFITFGATRACRHAVEDAQDMVGLLINTVPLGLPVVEGETVAELLTRLREAQRDLRAFETTALQTIIDSVPRSGGILFESIVVFDDQSLDARMRAAAALNGNRPDRHFLYDGQTNFPLTLLGYGDQSMSVRLEYALDRYDRAFAGQLVDHLVNLLTGFPANADRPASQVPYLTAAEAARYEQWNATETDYQIETTLHELFQQQVSKTPEGQALLHRNEVLSYRDFNQKANQLARALKEKGVGRDVPVGIFAERSFEMMISVYAILKAGGAYMPLDPEHPADRVGFMAEDSSVRLILTQSHLADQLPSGGFEPVVVDCTDWAWSDRSTDDLPAESGPGDVAYLLYTSGSTGRPKGVMIEHRAVINRLIWMQEAFTLDNTDCVLQKTPYTFDVSVWELFWPLLVGARLVMAEAGGHRDPQYMVDVIDRHRVTTLHFVPSMLQLFVEEPSISRCTSIRRVICSGEALPRTLQDRLFQVLDTELHNLYGPTEAAIDVTWWRCDPDSPLDTVPIGYPIANTQIHVLDRDLQRVPTGTQGELCIGGVQLARGYHNRPELTAEKFVPDPHSSNQGARLYRTGDLVRHLEDGAVEFLGRLDHQVKIRGQRIELGEIEAIIGAHPEVAEVVVTAKQEGTVDAALVAYVVGDPTIEAALKDFCAQSLAGYMVPTAWVFLEAMPLSPNGKADRAALPEPQVGSGSRTITAPTSTIESEIVDVWKTLLPDREIGVTDTFFEVGGNSIGLVKLAGLLTERFDRKIPVPELMNHPTVRQQATLLRGEAEETDSAVQAGAAQGRARRSRRRRAPANGSANES